MSPSWGDRVSYAPDGLYACVPGEVLIRPREGGQNDADIGTALEIANRVLDRSNERVGQEPRRPTVDQATWVGFRRIWSGDADDRLQVDVAQVVSELRLAGVAAQPNHVLFADPFSGNPFSGNPFSGNPFSGNPFSGNPFSGNPFSGNPFSGNPFSGNPFSGNPFSGNPFSGNPAGTGLTGDFCYGKPAPSRDHEFARTGAGPCLARPAKRAWTTTARVANGAAGGWPAVAVLDVAFPEPGQVPSLVAGCDVVPAGQFAVPDEDPPDTDGNGFLDRVAGHGLFVAGRIAQADPDCHITVHGALSNAGDGSEWEIARILTGLAGTVDVVNLSFGGYALDHMDCIRAAITLLQTTSGPASDRPGVGAGARLQDHGCVVVTSAGNDATHVAPYPAAFPGVVSVAALGPAGPASFTNYGDWVSACASGVDVVSTYFEHFDGKAFPDPMSDPDLFRGAASWSGTSFAAPLVAGKIARLVREHRLLPKQAVRRLLDGPDLARLPYLGTIVTD